MSFFSNFLGSDGEKRVIGVDIGSSAIKIVQIKKKNSQAILETYGELALGPYAGLSVGQAVVLPPDKIAEALVDLMKEKEVHITTNQAGLSIPFSSSLMSVMELPSVSDKQLATMVPLEARKYIPVPIAEVVLDWSVIPKADIGAPDEPDVDAPLGTPPPIVEQTVPKIEVLTVAIHKETISRYQQIVSKAQLEAGFFEIEIFATCRAVLEESLRPVMIMDMGAASTKLYIVERGIVRASHTVNRGSHDITTTIAQSLNITPQNAEIMKRQVGALGSDPNLNQAITLVLDYIFAESNTMLLTFEKKHNKTVSQVVLVGGGSALKGLSDLAKNNFKSDVKAGNPFSKVSTPAFLEKILVETGPEFTVAVGLALRRLGED